MKKVLSLITILFFLFANKTFAISYRDEIKLDLNPNVENTSNNINGSRLIEKYLQKLKTEIETFNEKYDINGDSEINNFLNVIEKMILSLRRIQTYSIEKESAEEIMKSIIKELKLLNPEIKSYLKFKKKTVENNTNKSKIKYVALSQKLSKKLSIFISEIYKKNKDDTEINKHLRVLTSENNKLINFNNLQFDNPAEVKKRFLIILNNIKKEFLEIKDHLKK